MLIGGGFTGEMRDKLWTECASTATEIENIVVPNNKEKPACVEFFGEKPKFVDEISVFGETGIVNQCDAGIKAKVEDQGEVCMFLGDAENTAGNMYKMLTWKTDKVTAIRDVMWLNQSYGSYMGLKSIVVEFVTAN